MGCVTITGKNFLAGLMACTMWASVVPQAHAAADSKAVTSWQVSRVASVSQGSYCAMAQKFDNQAILTFAQNPRGEYSLAIESPKAKFDSEKNSEVTLNVNGGGEATYNAKVQSPNAIVIGLGKGELIIGRLKKSGVLNVKMEGSQTSYQFGNYAAGQKDMGVCLAGIQASPEKSADLEKSGLKGVKSAPAQIERNAASIVVEDTEPAAGSTGQEPSVEGLLAARPSSSVDGENPSDMGQGRAAAPVKAIARNSPKPADINIIETTMDKEMSELRDENARLKRSLAESRKAYEDQQAKQSGPAVEEMHAKMESLQTENARLSADLDKATKTSKSNDDDGKRLSALSDELTRVKQSAETLKAENVTLRNQMTIAAKTGDKETQASSQLSLELADIKTENSKLKMEVASLKKISGGMTPDNLEVQQSMKGLEDRIVILRTENADLRQKIVDVKSSAGDADMGGDEKLRAQLREVRTQVATLNEEKASLLASIEKMQKDSEVSQLKAAGGSWDLEQATRRYQESQREIRRLGAMMDETTAKCQAEKKDIEYMLFDPEIAKGAQISMLNNLEDQIVEKDKVIKSLEAKQLEKQQPSPEQVQKMAALEKKATESDVTIANMRKELELAHSSVGDMKQQQGLLSQKDAEIAALQSKLTTVQTENQQILVAEVRKAGDGQRTVVDNLNAQLKAANDKSMSLEAQLAEIKTKQALEVQAAMASQNSTVAVLNGQLKAANDKSMSLEAQLAEIKTKQTLEVQAATASQNNAVAVLNSQLKAMNDKVNLLEGQLAQAKNMVQQAQLAAQIESAAGNYVPVYPSAAVPYQAASLKTQAPQAPGMNFMSSADIANLLASTGLAPRNGVQLIQGGDPATYRAYSWKTDSMFGSAEMRKVAGDSALPEVAKQYLSRAKSRCQGDFAADQSSLPADGHIMGYEIACVGNNNASSASVLFSYSDNVVTTIAHEGRAEAMDMVMDTRDKLASALSR